MRVSEGFLDFVLDQLAAMDGLRARAMFGGFGLYTGDVFFGLLAADVLFFKVDDTNRREYEKAGSVPFKPYADRPMTMSYYNVPTAVLEDTEALAEWAARAVAVAKSAKAAQPAKKRATAPTRPKTKTRARR